MNWKDWSITRRVILITVLPLLVMFFALLSHSYYSRLNEVEEELHERGQLVASLLAESSEYGLVSGDLAYLKPTIESLLQLDSSILSIAILNTSKRPILQLNKPGHRDASAREFEAPVKKALMAVNPFGGDRPHVGDQLSTAPTIKSQEVIGHVRVVASAIDILAKQRQRALEGAGIALASLALTVALGLALAMSLTKPLRRTIATVRAIRGGNHLTNVAVSTGGEMGELQGSIQDMAQRLTEFTRDLEAKVAERTLDLAAARDDALKLSAERVKLIQKVTSAVEQERREIANELHDHLNAQLIVIRLAAQRIAHVVENPNGRDAQQEISDVARSIVSSIADLYTMSRQLVRTLRPEILDTLGLSGAVEEMVRYYDALHKDCDFEFRQEGERREIDDEVSIAAYRLIQEALSNVVKHADAKIAAVNLKFVADGVRIEVRDDGKGFDPKVTEPGIGLIGMRERVQGFGRRLEILSKPGGGTTVVIDLPIAKPKHET
jgi:two-component system, NarL family, sensor histidine kinase UhpB